MNDVKIGIESGIWDHSSLDCFRDCPQYYDFRVNHGLIKSGTRMTSADFGTWIHKALENYYKEGMTDQSIMESMEIFKKGFIDDPTDNKRTMMKGLELLGKYFSRYRHEPFNVIATEIGGAIEIDHYMYSFRIDLTTEWLNPKGVYGIDTKTTSSMGRIISKPNNQVSGYDHILKLHYENVLGFIINAIGVYQSDEEMDKNAPKVKSVKSGKMIYQKKEREVLLRLPTSRTPVETKRWIDSVIHTIHMIEKCHESGVWPDYTKFCTAYASKCQFLDLCQAQDRYEMIQPLIDAGVYEVKYWMPYSIVSMDEEEAA